MGESEMRQRDRARIRKLCKALFPEDYQRLSGIRINDLGFGYDAFGLELESAMLACMMGHLLYEHWFRVESEGVERIPEDGPVLITPNHSGVIPIDGVMIGIDLVRKLKRPRIMRSVVYHFAGLLPYINTFFYRCGQVVGARQNFEELLKREELVTIFPEGAKGPYKGFRERYRLRPFNVGFVELSLAHRTPIVPTAVIGAEEQYPFMINFKPLARALNFPYFPVTPFFPLLGPLGMMPLPSKYYIYYGEPFHLYREHPPETLKDPVKVRLLAAQVRERIEEMIREGLSRRKSVFGLPFPRLSKLLPRQPAPARAGR
jgi:1-acyl-sn-glycerol-3-phosphate acyltransferase